MADRIFKQLDDYELVVLYTMAAKFAESSDARNFLHNAAPEHPVYRHGAEGRAPEELKYADNKRDNEVFRLGHELHNECLRRSPRFFEDDAEATFTESKVRRCFENWQEFCRVVVRQHVTV